jgi:hypothetical protein
MLINTWSQGDFISSKEFAHKQGQLVRGFNRTIIALANKNARIIWALMTKGGSFVINLILERDKYSLKIAVIN